MMAQEKEQLNRDSSCCATGEDDLMALFDKFAR